MKVCFDSFHGETLKSSEIAGLTLTETAYAPHLNLPKHTHESVYYCFVLQGGFTELYGKRSRSCTSSTLIFHPAGETHADCFQTASRCFNLKINAGWLERIPHHRTSFDEPADFRGGLITQLSARLYREFQNQDEVSALVIEGLTLEILGETVRQSAKQFNNPPRWLLKGRELLHDRFHENLSLSVIAHSVGVHETHLAREFRRYYGATVGEYIRHLRIEYVCNLLSASNAPLSEIALATGFFDQSHLARVFKSQTGMTPHEYRRTFRSR